MPPHCDALDGPVVKAAIQALETGDMQKVLPFVPKDGEAEVISMFQQVAEARKDGPLARDLADRLFFETVVRIHRAGEGAPYTGLKPAGLDVGSAIPAAEKAIATGSLDELSALLTTMLRTELERRFAEVTRLKAQAGGTVNEAREYVEAMLGFQVYSHKIYKCLRAGLHESHRGGAEA